MPQPEPLGEIVLAVFLAMVPQRPRHTPPQVEGLAAGTRRARHITAPLAGRLERHLAQRNWRVVPWVPRAQPEPLEAQETPLLRGVVARVAVVVAMVPLATVGPVGLAGAVAGVAGVVPAQTAATLARAVRVATGL